MRGRRPIYRPRMTRWLIEKSRQSYSALLKPMADSSFRVQTRYVLLTYSQCGDLDPWVVHDLIVGYPAECIIGREDHADGGTHLHAFVDFGRRVNIRDPRRFDVEGFHPNIQPCGRTPQKMLDYAIKDGDVVAGGLDPTIDSAIQGSSDVWSRIANAPTVDEFWDLARAGSTSATLQPPVPPSLRRVALSTRGCCIPTPRYPSTQHCRSSGLDEWVRDNLSGNGTWCCARRCGGPSLKGTPPSSARGRLEGSLPLSFQVLCDGGEGYAVLPAAV